MELHNRINKILKANYFFKEKIEFYESLERNWRELYFHYEKFCFKYLVRMRILNILIAFMRVLYFDNFFKGFETSLKYSLFCIM